MSKELTIYDLIFLIQTVGFWFYIWFGLMAASVIVAQEKGHSGIWTFLSYVACPPAAILFAIGAPDRKPKP